MSVDAGNDGAIGLKRLNESVLRPGDISTPTPAPLPSTPSERMDLLDETLGQKLGDDLAAVARAHAVAAVVEAALIVMRVPERKLLATMRYAEGVIFPPMHIYHVASGTPVVAILRPLCAALIDQFGSRPPMEDWLPPLKSTVIFLRQTDGRSKGSSVSSVMAAVAVGRCTSQFVEHTDCYVNRGLHVAAKFSP
jgi:hypothetical protein